MSILKIESIFTDALLKYKELTVAAFLCLGVILRLSVPEFAVFAVFIRRQHIM